MPRDQIVPYAIAALALGLVVAALAVVGGPGQGQMERRDEARFEVLRAFADCIAARHGEAGLDAAATSCAASHPPPAGDAPIRFELSGTKSLRVCASFEEPRAHRAYQAEFETDTGCLTRPLKV